MTALRNLHHKTAICHATALVDEGAQLGKGVVVGPFCRVGPHAILKSGVFLEAHVVIEGRTTVGEDSHVFPFAAVGCMPQDKKYQKEPSSLHIGARTIIREHATLNPGTRHGCMITRVGDDCLLMAGSHVAHDCQVGDRVTMANQATLGGHVIVGNDVVIGGLSAIHQFVRIGEGAFVSGTAGISRDVIPHGFAGPTLNRLLGLNLVGLKRRGASTADMVALQRAYRHLFESGQKDLNKQIESLDDLLASAPLVRQVVAFVQKAARPLCLPESF
jgi:UDP-N-acetylglucosamine acyltransferase